MSYHQIALEISASTGSKVVVCRSVVLDHCDITATAVQPVVWSGWSEALQSQHEKGANPKTLPARTLLLGRFHFVKETRGETRLTRPLL